MKYLLAIIGIVFVIFGWTLSNYKHLLFVHPLFTPKYIKAKSALDKIDKDRILREGDIGFSVISELFWEEYINVSDEYKEKDIIPTITKLEILSTGIAITSKLEAKKDVATIRITFSNSETIEGNIYELKSGIENKYLNPKIFMWGAIFFWAGIVISLFNILRPLLFPSSIQK